EATLRLIPSPISTETKMVFFDDILDAGKAISAVLSSRIIPSKLEIMNNASINAVEAYEPLGLSSDIAALILIALDGHPEAMKDEITTIASVCEQMYAREI